MNKKLNKHFISDTITGRNFQHDIPNWHIIILFLFGFFAIPAMFVPSLVFLGIAIPNPNIIYHLFQLLLCFFSIKLLWSGYCTNGISIFSRTSKLIIIFWILLSIRLIYDDVTMQEHNFFCLGRVFIPMLAFGLLSAKLLNSTKYFYAVFIPLAILCIGLTILLFDVLYIKGYTLRVTSVRNNIFWFNNYWFMNRTYTSAISPLGSLFIVLSIWAKLNRHISFSIFLICCFAGATCLFSSSSRSAPLGLVLTLGIYMILIILNFKDKRKQLSILLVIVILINSVSCLLIGRSYPKYSPRTRITKFINDLVLFVQHPFLKTENSSETNVLLDINNALTTDDNSCKVTTADDYGKVTINNNNNNIISDGNSKNLEKDIELKDKHNKNIELLKNIDTRGGVMISVLKDIRNNPILGNHLYFNYELPTGKVVRMNTHNGILTAFHGMGIVGGVIFLIILGVGCYNAYYIFFLSHNLQWLSLIFVIFFIEMLTGTPLQNYPEFWFTLMTMSAIVCSYQRDSDHHLNDN